MSADFVSLNVTGLDAINAQLTELGVELGAKVLATAARKAFKPVFDAAQRLVPKDTGALRDAIRLTVTKPASGDLVVAVGLVVAGPKKGQKSPKGVGPGIYWRFVELGTVKLAPHPFFRPALNANAEKVIELLKAECVKGIERALKKQARGALAGALVALNS